MAGTITIKYCDIEKVETDCIVNAANTGLHYGTGVCHAIFTGAGKSEMTEACDKIGYCEVGKAVVTPAFKLPAKIVIHAVGPYTDQPNAKKLLYSAYHSAMECVQESGYHKVTFPLISSGAFNTAEWPWKAFWHQAIAAVMDYQVAHPDYSIDVLFACHGRELIDAGNKVLSEAKILLAMKQAQENEESEKQIEDTSEEVSNAGLKHYRVYVAKMGTFRDSSNYEYIAEFESEKLASNYVHFMRDKKRYSDKDIIVQEVFVKKTPYGEETNKGKVVAVLTVLGEGLFVEEYEFT